MNTKNKIFGIFNVIDIIIIITIFAIGFLGYRLVFAERVDSMSRQETFIMKFYTEEVPDYVANALEIGGRIEDEIRKVDLGTIIDFSISPGFAFTANSDGEVIKAHKEGYSEVEIVSELRGELFENGAIVRGNIYGIGHSFTIRAGNAKIFLRVSGIERIE